MKKIRLFIITLLMLFIPTLVNAKEINVYVFYGQGCPHCADLEKYLDELSQDDEYKDKFNVVKYETWYDPDNKTLMNKVSDYFNANATGVPFYIIGDFFKVGFPNVSSTNAKVIEAVKEREEEIKTNINKSYEAANAETPTYEDIVAEIASGNIVPITSKTTTSETAIVTENEKTNYKNDKKKSINNILIIVGAIVALIVVFALAIWIIK